MANSPKALPPKVVAYLLDKLSSDDTFRELFVSNPVAALKQAGAPDPEDCARCMKVSTLAKKEVIQQTRKALENQLSNLALTPPQLLAPR